MMSESSKGVPPLKKRPFTCIVAFCQRICHEKQKKDKNNHKRKKTYDFQKAINEKQLDKNTYYSMQILMKLIISNSNYDVTIRIIYLLKDIIQQLSTEEDPIIYLILSQPLEN